MACNNKITADLLFDCTNLPVKGLAGGKAVLVNLDDIDRTATTESGATVSNLQLVSGSAGFSVEWYRELASTGTALTRSAEDVDGFSHSFLARLFASDALSAERANELKNGRFALVVETEYGGTDNLSKYKVYGLKSGLELSEMAGTSGENSSSLLFTLATREGSFEQYPFQILDEGVYATTKASYDSMFAEV